MWAPRPSLRIIRLIVRPQVHAPPPRGPRQQLLIQVIQGVPVVVVTVRAKEGGSSGGRGGISSAFRVYICSTPPHPTPQQHNTTQHNTAHLTPPTTTTLPHPPTPQQHPTPQHNTALSSLTLHTIHVHGHTHNTTTPHRYCVGFTVPCLCRVHCTLPVRVHCTLSVRVHCTLPA